ncbi:MAG: RNA 2',3'-cyclic phosphodiesterase [Haloferacaceae archaeon]
MKRLFLSIDLPGAFADGVAEIQERLRDAEGLRFVDPAQAHVTMKFLGDVEPDRIDDVESAVETALDRAAVSPFEATVADLGVFPSLDYISVVWLGVRAGSAEMTRLHEAIERETTAIGFDPEDHSFTPHVTIARMNDARGKALVRRVVSGDAPVVGSFRVSEVRLKESTLTDGGPEYDTLARFAL